MRLRASAVKSDIQTFAGTVPSFFGRDHLPALG